MTRLHDDPASFSDDMLTGFADVHRRTVRRVFGGVVRAAEPRRVKVAVVIGGGAGHYPAFCGIVGPGLADGAVVGNVFTSPSAVQVESVARAASTGRGVLLMSGNYTGDVINFELARDALCADGIDTTYLTVTDDVASAPPDEVARRRGVAGSFVVYKVSGAAAERGMSLAAVVRIAQRANAMTRTLGVAFGGCTLPGDIEPLFSIPTGRMSVGLGIHGEPGVSEGPVPTAAELADLLVDRLVADAPVPGPGRVAVVLNGLGSVKYEELFVVWSSVARRLQTLGFDVVEPEVGELVTSLDMAGCSLSVTWLDDELETLWCAAADSPAFRRSDVTPTSVAGAPPVLPVAPIVTPAVASIGAPDACAEAVVGALARVVWRLADMQQELGRLDAVAGDGDHGRGMTKGATAALDAAQHAAAASRRAGPTLVSAGEAWAASAGGTSGVLWGAGLVALGRTLGDHAAPPPQAWADAARAGYDEVRRLGGAAPGDKTMLDALGPYVDSFAAGVAGGHGWFDAWAAAADVARDAAQATASLRPRIGRARPLAERSVGTPDPGAISLAACVRAAMPETALGGPEPGDVQ